MQIRRMPALPSARWVAIAGLVALVAIALLPATAYAWTPGTHVFLGEAVLRTLPRLPAAVAELLAAFPFDFLYGSIAADTSMAKKYAPAGRHCHSWKVGREILDEAGPPPLRAFGLGYLAHLAADAIAHNYFVPKYLALASRVPALGHSYWESRFETHLGEGYSHRARQLILRDHTLSDAHLDRILSPTIFSTRTNRRIFRGMVHVADSESWQRIFHIAADASRWDLSDSEVAGHLERSYDFIMDLLSRPGEAEPLALDPAGDAALRQAKEVRRSALLSGLNYRLGEAASRQFALPAATLPYAAELRVPLYSPPRSASN